MYPVNFLKMYYFMSIQSEVCHISVPMRILQINRIHMNWICWKDIYYYIIISENFYQPKKIALSNFILHISVPSIASRSIKMGSWWMLNRPSWLKLRLWVLHSLESSFHLNACTQMSMSRLAIKQWSEWIYFLSFKFYVYE